MTKRRKLTAEEVAKVRKYAEADAKSKFPDMTVSVTVDDELDDDGKANWNIVGFKETITNIK
jgi:hypothetical protein